MRRCLRPAGFRRPGVFFARTFVWLATLCGVVGCSGSVAPSSKTPGLENLRPVGGSVSFNGQPPAGAVVLFHLMDKPDAMTPRIAGVVEEDGVFEMSTTVSAGTLPGVQEGDYLVTITWTEPLDPNDKDSDQGPDKLPPMYKDHKTSGLRATVIPGNNELEPFELVP